MKDRFKVYEKDADFVQDTKTGAMWLVKQTNQPKWARPKIRAPEPDYLAKILAEELNLQWPIREYHYRWDDQERPVMVGESMYHVHYVRMRGDDLTYACSRTAMPLEHQRAYPEKAMIQFCLHCVEVFRSLKGRERLLLKQQFEKLKKESE